MAAPAMPSAASIMMLSDAFAATLDEEVSSALLLPEQLLVSTASELPPISSRAGSAADGRKVRCSADEQLLRHQQQSRQNRS